MKNFLVFPGFLTPVPGIFINPHKEEDQENRYRVKKADLKKSAGVKKRSCLPVRKLNPRHRPFRQASCGNAGKHGTLPARGWC